VSGGEPPSSPPRGRVVDASLVKSILDRLARSAPGFRLLHTGAHGSSSAWEGDIDLVVTDRRETFLDALRAAVGAEGFSVVLETERVMNTLEIDLLFPRSTSWTVVAVDGCGNVLNFDATFAPSADIEILSEAGRSGISEVGDATAARYLILKRIRKEDDRAESWSAIAERSLDAAHGLEAFLEAPLVEEIADALARGTSPASHSLRRAHSTLRRRRALSRDGARALVHGALVATRRTYRPAGLFICIGGVDGSGKSALADALVAWSPFRRARRFHSRPGILKPPGWFIGRRPSTGGDPHGAEPWGPVMSALRLGYLWADFSIGHWARVWPVTARGGLVVSERWWWDMYVDPRRHRLQPMPRTARILGRLVPRADAFFVLEAPSEVIRARKQELSAAEMERQQAAWRRLAPAIREVRTIDASPPLPEVTRDVVGAVVERQAERLRRRAAPTRGRPDMRAFPRADPRWLFDPGDARTVAAAFQLYQPSRALPLAVMRGADTVTSAMPAMARLLGRLGAEPSPAARAAVDWVRERASRCLPGARVRIGAFLGSDGPTRKVSAVVVNERGDAVLFAKVASTAAAVAALENEARTLDGLRSIARSAVVPEVVSFERDARGALLLLTPVRGSRIATRAAPTSLHLQLISELLAVRRPADNAARRDALTQQLKAAPESAARAFLLQTLTWTEELWPAIACVHFSHGDLTPWNCLDCGSALGVVDWEMAGYRFAGWDAVHYVTQIESIARDDPVADAAARVLGSPFLSRVGPIAARASGAGSAEHDHWRSLQLLCLVESAVELLTVQPDISMRGVAVRCHAIAHLLDVAPPELEP
jgi:thymidylate kinase